MEEKKMRKLEPRKRGRNWSQYLPFIIIIMMMVSLFGFLVVASVNDNESDKLVAESVQNSSSPPIPDDVKSSVSDGSSGIVNKPVKESDSSSKSVVNNEPVNKKLPNDGGDKNLTNMR